VIGDVVQGEGEGAWGLAITSASHHHTKSETFKLQPQPAHTSSQQGFCGLSRDPMSSIPVHLQGLQDINLNPGIICTIWLQT
jgi:hypothetical protein